MPFVGNPRSHNIYHNGTAYIFKREGTSWNEDYILSVHEGGDDQFGWSVSIDGDYAIVGAYYEDNLRGAAYIFKHDGTEWPQQARLVAPDGAAGDNFGRIVSIKGDYAFVGAPARNVGSRKDSVYIFKRIGEDWIEEQKLILIPRARLTLFMKLLDSFPNAFPILRFLLTK